jgi:hypothetical protein
MSSQLWLPRLLHPLRDFSTPWRGPKGGGGDRKAADPATGVPPPPPVGRTVPTYRGTASRHASNFARPALFECSG